MRPSIGPRPTGATGSRRRSPVDDRRRRARGPADERTATSGAQGGHPRSRLGYPLPAATKAQPKEMLPLVDKPAIQYVVEEAVRAGLRDILIITGRGKRSLEDHFDR